MTIGLALADAAKNCVERGATAVITLKNSGVQYEGKLQRDEIGDVHLSLGHGGWVTIDPDEVAAVEARPS